MPYYSTGSIEIAFRHEEDKALADCDNTCENGNTCVCKLAFGTLKAGKAFFGGKFCILCTRQDVTKGVRINHYVNYTLDFASSAFISNPNFTSGAFIRYNKHHYKRIDTNAITQDKVPHPFSSADPYNAAAESINVSQKVFVKTHYERAVRGAKHKSALRRHQRLLNSGKESIPPRVPNIKQEVPWLTELFDLTKKDDFVQEHPGFEIYNNNEWSVCYCNNQDCNRNILSFVNDSDDIGVYNTTMDTEDEKVKCSSCMQLASYKKPDPKRNVCTIAFTYDKRKETYHLTQCIFCHNIISFNPTSTVQVCRICEVSFIEKYNTLKQICHFCRTPIVFGKKNCKGYEMYKVPEGDGTVELYLCRKHKIAAQLRQEIENN